MAANMANKDNVNVIGMKNIISAADQNDIPVLYVSTINAKIIHKNKYAKSKYDAELLLEKAGIKNIILRPPLIYDDCAQANLITLVNIVKRFPVIPVPPKTTAQMQPLFIDDLTKILIMLIEQKRYWRQNSRIVEIGGPEILSLDQMIRAIAHRLKKRRIIISIPVFALQALGILLILIGKRNALLSMLDNKTTSKTSVKDQFGFTPKRFSERIKKMHLH